MSTKTPKAIAKWGNSPALRIPKSVMNQASLHEGDEVQFEVQAPGLILVRAKNTELTLESLVSQITPENRHAEVDWGKPRGNEVW